MVAFVNFLINERWWWWWPGPQSQLSSLWFTPSRLFRGHSHCTKLDGYISKLMDIWASVIQGSAIDPASFIVTPSDLQPMDDGNEIVKFADDTYVIVPAVNSDTSTNELINVRTSAEEHNLKLNCSKSKKIVFSSRGARGKPAASPVCMDICQVHSITALGVVINEEFTVSDQVSSLLTSCSSSLYAMRVLRDHGLPVSSLQGVFRHSEAHLLCSSMVQPLLGKRPRATRCVLTMMQTIWILRWRCGCD